MLSSIFIQLCLGRGGALERTSRQLCTGHMAGVPVVANSSNFGVQCHLKIQQEN